MERDITVNIFRIGLLLNYFSTGIIVAWAENELAKEGKDLKTIDMLFESNQSVSSLVSILKEVAKENAYPEIVNSFFLGFYYDSVKDGHYNWQEIATELIRYYSLEEFSVNEADRLFISILNNDLSLRKDKLGEVLNMPNDLMEYLQKYNKYREIKETYNLPTPIAHRLSCRNGL